MKNRQVTLLILGIILYATNLFAQSSAVNVSPLTGAANVAIPVFSFNRAQVTFPVTLTYAGNGIKVKDIEGTAGMGWQLQAGGQISRVVRGLPDACKQGLSNATRLGWIYNTNNTKISNFTIQNTPGSVVCSQGTSDITYINSNFADYSDTEPDIFYLQAPGLSCQLIYDKSISGFRPIAYQDIKIANAYNSDGSIASFTVVNDKGIKYVFANTETTRTTTVGTIPSFFKTKFGQYQSGIRYYDSWFLSSMIDANGNGITLNYVSGPQRSSSDSLKLYVAGATTPTLQYTTQQTGTPLLLSTIQCTDSDAIITLLTFYWTNTTLSAGGTSQSYISSIAGMGRSLQFNYSASKFTNHSGGFYYRQFLRSFSEPGPNSPVNYQFSYYGETLNGDGSYTTTLPDSTAKNIDYWGYYAPGTNTSILPQLWVNPGNSTYQRYLIYESTTGGSNYTYTLTGNIMKPDPTNVMTGSLSKITYVQGGTTSITYEPNDFADPQSGVTNQGGGIRVKQITDYDGISTSHNIVRNYTYLNPSGSSSGKPVTLPNFAFTIPYSGSATGISLWQNATAISATDLSPEDHTVMYGYCRQSQTGAGVTAFQYYLPATNWDSQGAPGCNGCSTNEWQPTHNLVAKNSCSNNYGPIQSDHYSYPFIPNANYDFERGLLQKVTNYLDDGTTEVSETNYTYQRSYTPVAITAFNYDQASSSGQTATAYNKYTIFCTTSELPLTVTKKIFDSQNYSQSQSSTVNYVFGSSNHKQLTQQWTTNSDNSTAYANYVYTKDFTGANAGTDSTVTAIYRLKQLNINVPIESYQQINRGGSTKTTGASLTLFRGVTQNGSTFYLPSKQLSLVQPAGITNFTPFTATGSGSSQTTAYDSRYFTSANLTAYDNSGYLLTADDNNHHVSTTIIDHKTYQPIAVIKNAAFGEFGFTNFDYYNPAPDANFTFSSACSTPTGTHTGIACGLSSSQTISKTITKNAYAQNYIFSIWVNAPTGSNTLTFTLSGGTGGTYAKTYTGTGSWQYLEWKLPVSGLASSFTITITSSQSISIDDLLFYPDVAEVATAAYDPVTYYKTAQTNTNGVSSYFTNDTWGRTTYVYDQDRNIVQKNTFVTPNEVQDFSNILVSYTGTYANRPTNFAIGGADITSGTTVTWNFGDGSSTVTTAWASPPSHTYTSTNGGNPYTVTATVNSPFFGTKQFTTTITLTTPPTYVTLSYNNYTTSNGNINYVTLTSLTNSTVYTFTASQINSATVPTDNYTIKVYITGGQLYNAGTGAGYSCIVLTGDCNGSCANYASVNNYTFSLNLSTCTTLNFTVSQYDCSHYGGGVQ